MAHNNPDLFGSIAWLEVPVSDVPRAQNFYRKVFNWDCPEAAVAGPSPGVKELYFFHSPNNKLGGAFLLMEEDMHILNHSESLPHASPVLPSFFVKDCAEVLETVVGVGGKVRVPKTSVGKEGMGFFAKFIDCEGNMIGIWSAN